MHVASFHLCHLFDTLHYIVENYQESIRYYKQIIEEEGANVSQIQNRIAVAYVYLEQRDEALVYALAAIESSQGEAPQPYYNLVRGLYSSLGEHRLSREVLEKMVALFNEPLDRKALASLTEDGMVRDSAKKDIKLVPTYSIQPAYPPLALARGIEGWVYIQFTLTKKGEVKDAFVAEANPEEIFNEPVLAAISQFKFEPVIVDGVIVEVLDADYMFRFRLSK